MTVCATQAQTANDSVRIKLQTTAGADIAIDGDWSSTNIMYTKVATGQHNVTVRYGSLFEKNYPIEVSTTGNTEFSFLIEGEANISSMPQATIIMDGIPQGLTPQTLKSSAHTTSKSRATRKSISTLATKSLSTRSRRKTSRTH